MALLFLPLPSRRLQGWPHLKRRAYICVLATFHNQIGVYDLHGNTAEHMNLPLNESQMASRGSLELGYTEMKGSWFIFDPYYAHEDWCRWRAPFWHGGRVMDPHGHENYHLGFRCCKTIKED